MRKKLFLLLCLVCLASMVKAVRTSSFINTIHGTGNTMPNRYVMPILSNGDLSIHFNVQGTQASPAYNKSNSILWEGRRLGPPVDALFSFGHYLQELSYKGKTYDTADTWSQTLDTRNAEIVCENTYGEDISVKTEIIVHVEHNIVAIRKTFHTTADQPAPINYKFKYDLSASPEKFVMPHRMNFSPKWNADTQSLDISYSAIGHHDYNGVISLMSDTQSKADETLQGLSLNVEVQPKKHQPVAITFFILYADNVATDNFGKLLSDYKSMVTAEGYDGLAASHRKIWDNYWSMADVNIPDEKLERAYVGGLYQLRTNATRWSFPVGIGPWEGQYFAFDETYCYLGLASSNHLDIARRAPEFRKKYLQRACNRTRGTGARYPWQTLEDGFEGTPQPQGHWMDHVFHMSHITTACWTHFLFTNDLEYLRDIAFPVMKECARFFLLHMCYKRSDGSYTFGKTTDLERLGGAIENPFFSSCGAIYTFESTIKAAAILGISDDILTQFRDAAIGLRKNLPNDGKMYVPYDGCQENSIAVTTGMYPYPVLSTDDALERAAVLHFYEERYQAGNMYKVGSGLCPWYASWMASAMAHYGDRDKSLSLLQEAAAQIGYFSEHFEINEKDVVMNPWFTTAAGNYVHALDQTLLLNRDEKVFVCYAAPTQWKEYSFRLPCYGNMVVNVEIKQGKMTRCDITRNTWSQSGDEKTFYVPSYLLDMKRVSKEALPLIEREGELYRFTVNLSDRPVFSLVKNKKSRR